MPSSVASAHRALFDLASRLGSLEGYLYCAHKVEKKYLTHWLENIARGFACLPQDIRGEVQDDYLALLEKAHALLPELYGEQDEHTRRIALMMARRGDTSP